MHMSNREVAVVVITLLLAIAMVGCTPAATPTPVAESGEEMAEEAEAALESSPELEGVPATSITDSSWSVVQYGLENQEPPIEGTSLTINFMVDRYNGSTGCNYMLGVFDAENDSLLVRWPEVSAATCEDEELARQESDYLTALTTADNYAIEDNQLQLYYGDVSVMTLEPLEAVPFEGTTWNLALIEQQPVGWVPPATDVTLSAVFDGENISGSAGCNDYSGPYEIDGRSIKIGPLMATEMACEDEDLMQMETNYLQALESAAIIMQHAQAFELRNEDGVSMMIFSIE